MLDLPVQDFGGATRAFQVLEPRVFAAGMIIRFAGSTAPSGWLKCDGSSYDRLRYPALSRVIGGSGSTFTVPTVSGTPISIIKV